MQSYTNINERDIEKEGKKVKYRRDEREEAYKKKWRS